jgi:hypothetical protein
MQGVTGNESVIGRRGLLPEIGEGAGEIVIDGLRAGGLADEVPLDAGFERGFGEIAAADDEQAAGGIDDAPGLGVEGVGPGGELRDFREADFQRAVFADVGGERHPADQAAEGLGGSDVEVIADEDADAGLGAEGGEDRLLDEIEAGGLDEGGEEVDFRSGGNALADAFPKRGRGVAGGEGESSSWKIELAGIDLRAVRENGKRRGDLGRLVQFIMGMFLRHTFAGPPGGRSLVRVQIHEINQ